MIKLLIWLGRLAGIAGLLLGATAAAARAMGMWHVGSLQSGTLLLASIAAMALSAMAYSAAMAERNPQ